MNHPWVITWALCCLTAAGGSAWAAVARSRPPRHQQTPAAHVAGRTAYTVQGHGPILLAGRIPAPRTAPDYATTIPTGVTTPSDHTYAQQHADEINRTLGCTCSPSIGATVTEHTGPKRVYAIDLEKGEHEATLAVHEWLIERRRPDGGFDTYVFTGPTAENDAYSLGELLAGVGTELDWTMKVRTVQTATSRTAWVDVATYRPDLCTHGCLDGECPVTDCSAYQAR